MKVVIVGINSDIGYTLAERYSSKGYDVLGSYRTYGDRLAKYECYYCDLTDMSSINDFAIKCSSWKLVIFSVGDLKPVNKFFDTDFSAWNESLNVNALSQMRLFHAMYPYRNKLSVADVVFFAGGGVSRPVVDYSAYTVSKVILIKMCEILNDEYKDINPFIIGPGWVKTKIHKDTPSTAYNYNDVTKFLNSDSGTSFDSIFSFIELVRKLPYKIAGGRNFFIKDSLDGNKLKNNAELYKLRRRE